jgi:hypothetical protein
MLFINFCLKKPKSPIRLTIDWKTRLTFPSRTFRLALSSTRKVWSVSFGKECRGRNLALVHLTLIRIYASWLHATAQVFLYHYAQDISCFRVFTFWSTDLWFLSHHDISLTCSYTLNFALTCLQQAVLHLRCENTVAALKDLCSVSYENLYKENANKDEGI